MIKAEMLKKKKKNAEGNANPHEIEDEVLNHKKKINQQTGKI